MNKHISLHYQAFNTHSCQYFVHANNSVVELINQVYRMICLAAIFDLTFIEFQSNCTLQLYFINSQNSLEKSIKQTKYYVSHIVCKRRIVNMLNLQ